MHSRSTSHLNSTYELKCTAGREPSTWSRPGRLVEQARPPRDKEIDENLWLFKHIAARGEPSTWLPREGLVELVKFTFARTELDLLLEKHNRLDKPTNLNSIHEVK